VEDVHVAVGAGGNGAEELVPPFGSRLLPNSASLAMYVLTAKNQSAWRTVERWMKNYVD
jgi:hypothetical protein